MKKIRLVSYHFKRQHEMNLQGYLIALVKNETKCCIQEYMQRRWASQQLSNTLLSTE